MGALGRVLVGAGAGFSALQRAEIAEIVQTRARSPCSRSVSVLFNEPKLLKYRCGDFWRCPSCSFSALQRAEIAEIFVIARMSDGTIDVSVLFNEPKLLKFYIGNVRALEVVQFQCSSTSRNC